MNQPTLKQPHELWRETLMTAWNNRIAQDKSSSLHLLFASTEQDNKRRTSQSHQRS